MQFIDTMKEYGRGSLHPAFIVALHHRHLEEFPNGLHGINHGQQKEEPMKSEEQVPYSRSGNPCRQLNPDKENRCQSQECRNEETLPGIVDPRSKFFPVTQI